MPLPSDPRIHAPEPTTGAALPAPDAMAVFIAEARRQSHLIAAAPSGEEEIMRWIDHVADREGWR